MLNNEYLYKQFDELMLRIESWLQNRIFPIGEVDEHILRKRVSQKIMQLIFYPYSISISNRIETDPDAFALKEDLLVDGVRINNENAKPTISPKLFISSLILFWGLVIIQLKSLVAVFFTSKRIDADKYVLMLDSGSVDFSDIRQLNEFRQYCKDGPISILHNQFILIKSEHKFNLGEIQSSKNPVIDILNDKLISKGDIFSLILQTIYNAFRITVVSFRNPLVSIIATDFVNLPVIKLVNKKRLLDGIIITTSSMFSQPLWMRAFPGKHFSTHFVNYSNNSVKFIYRKSPFFHFFPALRHISVDEQWVWNDNHGKMYRQLGHQGNVHVVGPILYYLRKKQSRSKSNEIKICLFDVTPATENIVSKLGLLKYYYTIETVTNFIQSVLEVCKSVEAKIEQPVRVLLKHKREFTSGFHAPEYKKNVEVLLKQFPSFSMVSYNDNLYELLEDCTATVSIPYTSTAFVSASINLPAIYFDATGELAKPFDADAGIAHVYSKEELENQIGFIINERFPHLHNVGVINR